MMEEEYEDAKFLIKLLVEHQVIKRIVEQDEYSRTWKSARDIAKSFKEYLKSQQG